MASTKSRFVSLCNNSYSTEVFKAREREIAELKDAQNQVGIMIHEAEALLRETKLQIERIKEQLDEQKDFEQQAQDNYQGAQDEFTRVLNALRRRNKSTKK
jgi:TolA-binding protein